jgi:GNAT superfamily N-acetyltransferase
MIATRHRNDAAPALTPIDGLRVRRESDASVMAGLQHRTELDIGRRLWDEHRAYVASIDGEDVAFGWVATSQAMIGEIDSAFFIPKGERYLWNFVTMPGHRGKGIYPRLLDAIVREEATEAERFWVAYAPENHASGVGIEKAGFTTVAQISFDQHGRPAIRMLLEGAPNPAKMLGLRTLEEALAQCWRCVRMGRTKEQSCAPDKCRCDYQRPESSCDAGVEDSAHAPAPLRRASTHQHA